MLPRKKNSPEEVPGAKWIPLTKGKFALVDTELFEKISKYNWYCGQNDYPRAQIGGKKIHMHKFILSSEEEIDHINRNPLDNRQSNLRIATSSQNKGNTIVRIDNTSGYKGVRFDKSRSKWLAEIRIRYKSRFLGYHKTKEEAAHAYDAAAREYFGEFARLNLPNEGERGCR